MAHLVAPGTEGVQDDEAEGEETEGEEQSIQLVYSLSFIWHRTSLKNCFDQNNVLHLLLSSEGNNYFFSLESE